MLRRIAQIGTRFPGYPRPLIQRPSMARHVLARPPKPSFSIPHRQIRGYSSESGHSGKEPDTKVPELLIIITSWSLVLGIYMGWFYYTLLPGRTARRQAAEVLSMTTAQIPVPDDYDQPATPQRTRQVLERQRCLDDYRFPLFHDIRERCERCCTESSVLCPLSQEIHAIYAREFGKDKKLAMISRSCQNKNRTIKEELKWLARLSKKRSSMFYHLSNRCEELCSDSPRPCHIWQEVYRIHRREMDAQEKEGGEKGMLRGRLNSWF